MKRFFALAASASLLMQSVALVPVGALPNEEKKPEPQPQPKVHEIKYCAGEYTHSNPNAYTEGVELTLQAASKDGFEFIAWYKGDGKKFEEKDKMIVISAEQKGKLDLCPKFEEIKTHTLTYVLNGGAMEGDTEVEFEEDESITLATPSREHYSFAGWFTTVTFDEDTDITVVEENTKEDVTVYAKWVADTFEIKYEEVKDSNNSDINPSFYTYDVDQEIKTEGVVKTNREGKVVEKLAGWYTDKEKKNAFDGTIDAGTYGKVTLYAKWNKIHDIAYDLPEGAENAETNPATYEENGEVVTFADPSALIGYTFDAWYQVKGPKHDQKEEKVTSTEGLKGKLDLRAKYTTNAYVLTIDNANGDELSTVDYTIESDDYDFETPVRDGYEFMGYVVTDAAEDSAYTVGEYISGLKKGESYGDLTITATWHFVAFLSNEEDTITEGEDDVNFVFVFDASDLYEVYLDGELVPADNLVIEIDDESGLATIMFAAEYIKSLKAGTYNYTVKKAAPALLLAAATEEPEFTYTLTVEPQVKAPNTGVMTTVKTAATPSYAALTTMASIATMVGLAYVAKRKN